MFVIVTIAEMATTLAEAMRISRRGVLLVFGGFLAWGLYFLSRHDTESGHWPILTVLIGSLAIPLCRR